MTFSYFQNLVANLRKKSLPGIEAQLLMTPENRRKALRKLDYSTLDPRYAAVMFLAYPATNNCVHFTLILRNTYKGVHSNQIALPGGGVEAVDVDYSATALREVEEEIGVNATKIEVIKELTDVYIPPSNFQVKPFMGIIDETPKFIPQQEEVQEIIEVDLDDLMNDNNLVTESLSTSYAKDILVQGFNLNDYLVWGATAMILSEIKVMLQDL
ncbi:MAG: NUDIX hydrolase [Bacteroidota bacterium]